MKRILIVDDSPLILAQLTDILTSLGYETVGSAASGAEAIDLARTLRPDAILMDIVMPGEPDGIGAARLIHQELDIPTIFLTGSRNADVVSRIRDTGAYGYIEKPVSQSEIGAAIEIALRQRQSVRKIADLYEDLVENTSDFVYVLDGRGNIEFLNTTACRALGGSLDRLKGRNIKDLIPSASYRIAAEVFARRLEGEQIGNFELELYDAEKNVRTIETRERPKWENGRIVEVYGIGRDVTERKRAEELFRKREERYRIITENMRDTVWVLDKNLRPVFASPSVERARGYTLEEIQNLPLKKNLTPGSFDTITKAIVGMLIRAKAGADNTTLTEVMDLEWYRKDGTTYWTEVSLTLIADEKGNPVEILGVGRDITERTLKERVLRESEERYRALFEDAAFGIFHSLAEGRFIRVNASVARILGYDSPDDVISSIQDFGKDLYVNPEDRQKSIEVIARQEGWGFFEAPWRRKDGSVIIAKVHIRLVFAPDGEFQYVEGILEDVTEERNAQNLVQYLKEFNETIINNMVDSIDIIDKDYTIIFQNSTAKRKFGEGVGRKCHEFYHGRDNPCTYCMAPEALAQRRCSSREVQMEDGTYLEVHSSPIKMPDGTLCSMEIMRDITERKRAEEALKASEEKHRTILHTMEDGYFEVDIKGSYTSFNDSMSTMLGYDPEEMVGLNYRQYMDKEIADSVFLTFNEIFRTGVPAKTVDWRLNRKDGTKLDIETSISLTRDRSGKPTGFFGITRDITERRKAEETIRDSEQRYRLLAENANDIIFTTDMNMVATYVSPSVIRLLGFLPEEVTARSVQNVLAPTSLELAKSTLREELELEASGTADPARMRLLELEEICKDGSTVWTETTLSFLRDTHGKPVGVLGLTRDITERKRAQEAIRDSERLYRLLAENVNDVIFIMDMNLVFTYVSPSVMRLRGFTVQETHLQTPADVLTEGSLTLSLDTLAKELKEDAREGRDLTRTTTLELEIYCKDGSTVWTETTFSPLRNEKGAPTAIIGVVRDITERRKAEELIRESEQRYRLLAENANDAIFTTDMNLQPTYVSPSMVRLRGFSPEETLAQNVAETLTPASLELAMTTLVKELEIEAAGNSDPNRLIRLELEGIRKDGSTVWGETTLSFLRDSSGSPVGILGITRDISERRKAEEALRLSEEKFRNVFETSRDLLYIATIDGKMLEYSKSAKELLGYTDDELLMMNIQDHYAYPEERDRFVRKILDEGYLENYELKLKKKNGVLIDTLITAAIRRDASGAVIGLQGAVKDITRMKRLEQQLLQSEKLSGLGTMISGVAHELNNPLTVIMGNTELMLMDQSISIKDNKSLRVIFKESERAAKIVSGLLTFAREHRPERRTIKINDIIEESYRLREYNLMTNNIEVILSLSPDIPPILADPYQLQQVFTNIIHNARDALMETGGGTLTIRSFCRDETISIEFEDSGPGITKENMKRIFDPFFTTKDVGKGTGLGLSMAYGIINEHGGTIEAESAAGSGAKFTVDLPVITGPDSNIAEPGPSGITPVKGKLILVVDDERYIRDLLKQALSERGHQIKTASTVEEAIHLSEQNTFDAVVLDIKMPGMGGKELYAHIRNNSPELANRMLFITGDVLSDDTQVFLKTSAAKYIEKPFKIDAFIKALNDVLGI